MATPPGPTTRARSSRQPTPVQTALPALDTKASYSYGAKGKATLHTQVAQDETDFDAAFQGAANAGGPADSRAPSAQAEDHDDDYVEPDQDADEEVEQMRSKRSKTPARRLKATSPRKTSPRKREQSALPALAEEEESDLRGVNDFQQAFNAPPVLAAMNALPASRPPQPQPQGSIGDRTQTFLDQGAAYHDRQRFEPGIVEVTAHTIPRYVLQVLREGLKSLIFLIGCLVVLLVGLRLVIAAVPSAGHNLESFASSMRVGWDLYRQNPPFHYSTEEELKNEWLAYKYEHTFSEIVTPGNLTQRQINVITLARVDDLEKRLVRLERKLIMHDNSLAEIKAILPNSIVVEGSDGHWSLPEHFWPALFEGLSEKGRDSKPLWDSFLENNHEQLQALLHGSANEEVERAVQNKQVITSSVLQSELEHMYDRISRMHQTELQNAEAMLLEGVRAQIAQRVDSAIDQQIENLPGKLFARMQGQSLAYVNQVINSQNALTTVNFFSPNLGARVLPHLTSPTFEKLSNRGWFEWAFGPAVKPHPPIVALSRWDEATDCWCAAKSNAIEGKAQIAVMLGHKIYPERLVIEHIHPKGTLDIASAPMDFEVWAEAASRARAQDITRELEERRSHFVVDGGCKGSAPGPNYVCIMNGRYQLHADNGNWVQSFSTSLSTRGLDLGVDRVIVRALSNWGREHHTCFYRLRMLGERVNQDPSPLDFHI